jgi:hypothetical protein
MAGQEIAMQKYTYFLNQHGEGWPELRWLERFFLTAGGREEAFGEQESWGLKLYGVDGTEHLERYKDRIDINMTIQGDLSCGILLWYNKSGGRQWVAKYSKGDPAKWRQWIETPQGDRMSVALFIPFETAWKAVKEFIERDAALPQSIDWITDKDLPDYAFRPEFAG